MTRISAETEGPHLGSLKELVKRPWPLDACLSATEYIDRAAEMLNWGAGVRTQIS
jgi:hypothetical protein